jgi:Cytidylyltransferase-like
MQVNKNSSSSSSAAASSGATSGKTAFFIYGRFQPPHMGHIEHIVTMLEAATKAGADAYIFPSPSLDGADNPLSVDTRIEVIDTLLKAKRIPSNAYNLVNTVETPKTDSPFITIPTLLSKGYSHIVLFASGDRMDSFNKMIESFTGRGIDVKVADTHRALNDDGNPSGISGTKMREKARANPFSKAIFDEIQHYIPVPGDLLLQVITEIRNGHSLPPIIPEDIDPTGILYDYWDRVRHPGAAGGYKRNVHKRSTRKRKQKNAKKSKKIRRKSRCRA